MRFTALVLRETRLLVQRDNSLPGAVLADFAPLGASVVLLRAEDATERRLGA
jgi:hypothetical protein